MGCVPFKRIIMTSNNSINYSVIRDAQICLLLVKFEPKFVSKPKSKTCKKIGVRTGIYYIILCLTWIEIIFLQLELVDNIFTLCPHIFCYNIGWVLGLHYVCKFDCIQACIQDECFIYHSCVISNKPQSSTISFTISPDNFACIFTYDQFKEFHLQLALKEEEENVRE